MSDDQNTETRGRPPYEPSKSIRNNVEIWLAGGMSKARIAVALGIDEKTLEKHFPYELTIGAAKRQGEVIKTLYNLATDKKGAKIAAAKQFLRKAELDPEAVERPQEPARKEVGKKVQALIDAQQADGSVWDKLAARSLPPTSDTPQ